MIGTRRVAAGGGAAARAALQTRVVLWHRRRSSRHLVDRADARHASPALARALAIAHDRAISSDLLIEEPVPPAEAGSGRSSPAWRCFARRRIGRGRSSNARSCRARRSAAARSSCSAPRARCRPAMPTRSPRGRRRSTPARRRRDRRRCCSTRICGATIRSGRPELVASRRAGDAAAGSERSGRRRASRRGARRKRSRSSTRISAQSPDDHGRAWLLLHALYRAVRRERQTRRTARRRAVHCAAGAAPTSTPRAAMRALAADWMRCSRNDAISSALSGGGAGGFPSRLQRICRAATRPSRPADRP